jgi:hypothetical protein
MKKKNILFIFFIGILSLICILNRNLFISITSPFRKEIQTDVTNLRLPQINLTFNKALTKHFENLYKGYTIEQNHTEDYFKFLSYYKKNNTWKNAQLEYEGKSYTIKIKSHGKTPSNHKEREYISLSIKLISGQHIKGANRFNLIIYWRVKEFDYPVYSAIAQDLDLLTQKTDLVEVNINNKKGKLYFFEYRVNKKYLNEISTLDLTSLRRNNNKSLLLFDDDYDSLKKEINQELKGEKYNYLSSTDKKRIETKFNSINSAISKNKHENIDSFFDVDYVAKTLAMKTISGTDDGFEKCNFILPFSLISNKFYPIIHRDCEFNKIESIGGIDSIGSYFKLLKLANRNDAIRIRKYEILYEYISKTNIDSLELAIDSIQKFHESLYYSSKIKYFLGLNKSVPVINNLKKIKEYLDCSNPKIKFIKTESGFNIELEPNSFSPLSIKTFSLSKIDEFDHVKITIYEKNIKRNKSKILLSKSGFRKQINFIELFGNTLFYNKISESMSKEKINYLLVFEIKDVNNDYLQINKGNISLKIKNEINNKEILFFN